jgi:hypothetical protein
MDEVNGPLRFFLIGLTSIILAPVMMITSWFFLVLAPVLMIVLVPTLLFLFLAFQAREEGIVQDLRKATCELIVDLDKRFPDSAGICACWRTSSGRSRPWGTKGGPLTIYYYVSDTPLSDRFAVFSEPGLKELQKHRSLTLGTEQLTPGTCPSYGQCPFGSSWGIMHSRRRDRGRRAA